MPETTTFDVAQLRSSCKGEALGPGDDGFDAARQTFNLMVDQRLRRGGIPQAQGREGRLDPDGILHANHPISTTP